MSVLDRGRWIGRRVVLREALKTVGGKSFPKGSVLGVGNVEPSRRSSHQALVLFSESGDCIRQVRCRQVRRLPMTAPLAWEKHSHKRFVARVGPLSVEVHKVGSRLRPELRYWTVGEVLGNHFLREMPQGTSLQDAQAAAEAAARKALVEAAKVLGIRVRDPSSGGAR